MATDFGPLQQLVFARHPSNSLFQENAMLSFPIENL